MAALQDYGSQPSALQDDSSQGLDLSSIIGVAKRRYHYFVIPFLLIALAGFVVIKRLPPTYQAQGEILVESPAIPPDLVHPTITELADQRFAVIKDRIMAENNLVAMMNKYNLFPKARASMPAYLVLDLMRSSVKLAPAPLEMSQPGSSTSAFTVSFDYEDPTLALAVTNDFIRQILSQDTSRRTSDASEITKFLEQQVKSLQDERNTVIAQIAAQTQPGQKKQAVSEEIETQMKALGELEAELVQKSMVYSDEYPAIKDLKRKIAALKQVIASAPPPAAVSVTDPTDDDNNIAVKALEQQELNLEKDLDEANRKLAAARLGENMEKNQQAEHLQLISAPELPHQPVGPKKPKMFGMVIAFAGMIGGGAAFAAEMLDRSIHSSRDLARIVDPRLIVTIPYVFVSGEESRRRRKIILLSVALAAAIMAAVIALVLSKGTFIDLGGLWVSISSHFAH
jgi:capsular polysaccharide biosynthesis protein